MSNTERRKVLNYRNANGISPNPNNIDYGEIAIGYKKDNEAIYIKNSTNEIVDFTPISIVNLTYNDLKNLRDNSKLKPSQYYRITDFVTTVANDPEARSAGHPFDIIVLALDKNKLHEECHAIQHEGDTYFADCNLAAWKIWYCLDNDTTKYMWADTANGKGVIYRMIDEWGNDCPYDFKNVQFKRYAVKDISPNGELADLAGTYIGYNNFMNGLNIPDQNDFIWAYTFSIGKRIDVPNDASIIGYNSTDVGEGYGYKGYYGDNIIKPSVCHIVNDEETITPFCLNNIVWYDANSRIHGTANNIIIESECSNMTLSGNAHHIGYDNRNLIMGTGCIFNTIGDGGDMNTFGNYCGSNTFGDGCRNNTFGDNCGSNTFGNNCSNNTFGIDCGPNTFGDGCSSNTFGIDCGYNTFGKNCGPNTFGDNCNHNTFGNNCGSNTFGIACWYNSFSHGCGNNRFGKECNYNSFGKNCGSNIFYNYFKYNYLGNDVEWIAIQTDKIYHTQILNGTKGDYIQRLKIEFTPETKYSQFAGLTSDNILETWVEADDPHDGVDCGSY